MQKSKDQIKSSRILGSKQIFLLLFARELIRNSEEGLLQLKRILETGIKMPAIEMQMPEQKAQPMRQRAREEFPMIKSILSQQPRINLNGEIAAVKPVHIEPTRREVLNGHGTRAFPILRIPEPKLPPEFQHLKPTPSTKEIDLDKLNALINDPAIKKIECDGPNKLLIVSGNMGRRPTELSLSNNEIEDVVERFSRAAKIPVEVGVFRVVVGNLIFSAIVSDVVPSRFVITKIIPTRQTSFRPVQQTPYPINMSYSNYITPLLKK